MEIRLNTGALVSFAIFLLTQSGAFIWWASSISSDVQATRMWQVRQDDRLAGLENKTDVLQIESASTNTLLEKLTEEVAANREEILTEIRRRGLLPPQRE